jgi:signal transduction histidine kinase
MFKQKKASIRVQLLVLVLAVALPLLGLIAFAAYLEIEQANKQAYNTVEGLSQLTAAHVQQLLSDSQALLAEIAARPQIRALDPTQCDPLLPEIPRLFNKYAAVTLIGAVSGEVYCTAVAPDINAELQLVTSVADQDWFQEAIHREQFTVSEALISQLHGHWVTILSHPVYDFEDRLGGVLTLSIHLVRYQAALERISLPTESTITMIDGRGTVLAHSEESQRYVGLDGRSSEIVRLVLEENVHTVKAQGLEDQQKFFGVARIPDANWIVYAGIPTATTYAPVQANLLQLALLAMVIILLVSLLAINSMNEIEQPVRALAQVAAAVAAGQLERRAPVDGPEEFRAVALQFNEMLAANSRHQAELERYAHRLEMANQELESFAYSVSHDLRAPLRALSGFSQMLSEEYQGQLDENAQHYLKRIQAASQHMGHLIDDLLNLAQVSRSEIVFNRINLSEMAQQILAELQQRNPGRSVQVIIGASCEAVGDTRLLRIALKNLLENAWKFTAKLENSQIEFGCSLGTSGQTVYYVRDNGEGFDMAYAGKLFGAFQRLHSEAEFPGTGIGLATVQRVIRRHGGHIWAEAAVAQGATFFFTIPGM